MKHFFSSRAEKIKQSASLIFIIIIAAIFGYLVGLYVQKNNYAHFLKSFRNIRENSTRYMFINPLIGGVSSPATDVGLFADISDDIRAYLKKEEDSDNLYNYSFYFRDLNTGLWFGINESTDFFPASLFKLPIALAVYKQAEADPGLLVRQAVYTKELSDINNAVSSNSQSSLEVGKTYSVEELVTIMLTNSDNGAKNLLLTLFEKKYLDQLFSIVSLVNPVPGKTYLISSREYALFFRVLYGSSYLNEEHSEHILSLLAKSTFKDGLVAGVPETILVAHKFGTYEFEERHNGVSVPAQQLHDCGVVYHERNPYIFCLMTKGKDEQTLFKIISHVSKMVYDYQDNK